MGCTPDSLDLCWTAPVHDGGTAIHGYSVLILVGDLWLEQQFSQVQYETPDWHQATVRGLRAGSSYSIMLHSHVLARP